MTARKLSESEKKDILHLYRTTGETSSSLAAQYGVSTSTVSRLLKSTLPADEYEALIQQKRSLRSSEILDESTAAPAPAAPPPAPTHEQSELLTFEPIFEPTVIEEPLPAPVEQVQDSGRAKPILRRSRRRSGSTDHDESDFAEAAQLEVPLVGLDVEPDRDRVVESGAAEAEVLKEILSQDLIEPEEDLADDLDDELDEDDDDDDDFEDGEAQPLLVGSALPEGYTVQILPLAEAPIPRTCYLVVDRAAELIAPPLRDFGDLGQIPAEEVQAKTLPIFDNHRIAKRYSNPRTQRVIKLPDGRVLSKTAPHLRAKGITHLLIDGRVYSLN